MAPRTGVMVCTKCLFLLEKKEREGEREKEREGEEARDAGKSTRRDIESAGDTWTHAVFSATDFVRSFLSQLTFLYLGILRKPRE